MAEAFLSCLPQISDAVIEPIEIQTVPVVYQYVTNIERME